MGSVTILWVLAVISVLNIFTSAAPFPPPHGDYGWYPQSHVVLPASIDGVKVWVLNQGLPEPRYIYGGGGYDYDQERLFEGHDLDKVDIRDGPEEEVLGVYEGAVLGVWKGIEYPVGIGGGFEEVPEEKKGKKEEEKKEERQRPKEEEDTKKEEPSKGEEAVLKAEEELQKEVEDKEGSVEVGHKVIDVSQEESEEGSGMKGEEPEKEVDESVSDSNSNEKEEKPEEDVRAVPEKIVDEVDVRKKETTEETPTSDEDEIAPLNTKMEKGREGKTTDEVLEPRGVLPLDESLTTEEPDVSTDSTEENTVDPEDSAVTTEQSLSSF